MNSEALADYDRLGFCVIPLAPRDKRPLPEWASWATYQKRRSTPDEWARWWQPSLDGDMPNIGVVTGEVSAVVVIDCDDEGTYDNILFEMPELWDTMTVSTGKGKHIYVRPLQPHPIRTSTFAMNGMVHHIKAEGSYVVAPPSIHPSGRQYQWANDLAPAIVDMVKLGAAILRAGGEPRQPQGKDRPTEWAEELFTEGTKFGTGSRNDTLAQLGGLLRHYFPQDRWGLGYAILRDWNEKYCDPPLPESEVRATAFSLSRYDDRPRSPARRGT